MNEQQFKRIKEFETNLVQAYNPKFSGDYGNTWNFAIRVNDLDCYRTFDLNTFYEFSDYNNIDTSSIDYTIDIPIFAMNRGNTENVEHTSIYKVRVLTYPDTRIICINIIKGYVELTKGFLEIILDFVKSLKFTSIILSSKIKNTEEIIIPLGFSKIMTHKVNSLGGNSVVDLYSKQL